MKKGANNEDCFDTQKDVDNLYINDNDIIIDSL